MVEKNLIIAKLRLGLEKDRGDFNLIIPPSHQKFNQPVIKAQAHFSQLSDSKNEKVDYLVLKTSATPFPKLHNLGEALLSTKSWSLREGESGNYTLFAKEDIPPRLAIINHDFTEGDLFFGPLRKYQDIYPPGELEIRLFSVWLARFGDIILHASGVVKDGKGYCFLGEAGAGKSTLARILFLDPSVTVLGEDTLILRYIDGYFWIFGTPWHLDPDYCSPLGVKLEKIFYLDRFKPKGIKLVSPIEALSYILKTAIIPFYHPYWLSKVLENLERLSDSLGMYTMSYQLNDCVWGLLYDHMM